MSRIAVVGIILALVATVAGLKCWKCGMYSDGVGSITPCPNRTTTRLDSCKKEEKYCIKYVSELTVVRDCVVTCSEKEWWGARTFCCDTDECNMAFTNTPTVTMFAVVLLSIMFLR